MAIRVVVADDNYLMREAVSRLVDAEDDLAVIGSCGTYDELVALVDESEPDVVVTDIRMPPTGTDEGIRAAARLRATHPSIGVVVLSQYAAPSYAVALLDGGSEGRAYLLKDRVADVDDLRRRGPQRGGGRVGDRSEGRRGSSSAPESRAPLVTDRATHPARAGDPRRDGAGQEQRCHRRTLVLSERAVEKHINSIFSKLHLTEEPDVNRRVKAVLVLPRGRGRLATPQRRRSGTLRRRRRGARP